MKKTNTILSIISLFLTSLVFIVIIYGWYVVNKTVSATGISGSVIEHNDIIAECNIYSFSSVTTNNGNSTYTLTTEKDFKYNPDFDKTPTAKLIEVKFILPAVNLDLFRFESNAGYYPGFSSSSTSGYITSTSNISLSGVVKFLKLDNVTFSEGYTKESGTVTFPTPVSYDKFNYNETTGAITTSHYDYINTHTENVTAVYMLIDFDSESFENLYSNNIGNRLLDEIEQLSYSTDFKIKVSGSVVTS